jgi:uncharacterized membrane protein YsdA (DUF1294 family)
MSHYYKKALILWVVLTVGGAIGFGYVFGWGNPVYPILLATNAATFMVMGYDKMQASNGGARTPEVMFYLMTLLGGSAGMLAGMYLFRHKTRKISFQFFVGLMILLQVALLMWLGQESGTMIIM